MTKLSGPMLAPRSGKPPRQIVVLLHGYGADGEDLIDLGRLWGEAMPDALFVSPNAPNRCAGNPFGYEWFPLQVDRIAGRIEGAREAAPVIRAFLDDLWAQTGLSAAHTASSVPAIQGWRGLMWPPLLCLAPPHWPAEWAQSSPPPASSHPRQ